MTQDVDAAVIVEDAALGRLIESGRRHGFLPRIANPVEFALVSLMLPMTHEADGVKLDLALARSHFELQAIRRAKLFCSGDVEVRVPRVEDLIIMKAVSARPIDLMDIDTLLEMHPRADRRTIRRWTREFAELLDAPEIAEHVERLLARKRVPLRRKKPRRPGQ